ncbi:MAG: GGDEF domain-containing protein [Rhodobacteraceae bacterium]|nr:GGDEF domain-containing protein [Paracoccaceae bacterium]
MIPFSADALDRLMPLHVALAPGGQITHAGPTLTKIGVAEVLEGADFFEVFSVDRPAGVTTVEGLFAKAGQTLKLRPTGQLDATFKAILMPLEGDGAVLNLSFGITMIEAVGKFGLTQSDFAPTDMTVEMLFLSEARAIAMREWRTLSKRLNVEKLEAEEQAFTDPLTGIGNRRAFDRDFSELEAGRRVFGLIFADLDRFKPINDTFGHEAGDHVLKEFARLLTQIARSGDTVFRLGGDEFAIVLHDRADGLAVRSLGQRLLDQLDRPVRFSGHALEVRASLGATTSLLYAVPDQDAMSRDADAALYSAKNAGRNALSIMTENGIRTYPASAGAAQSAN